MRYSTKINSIAVDLTRSNNEVGLVECDGFSIRGRTAEARDLDPKKCWPFSEESYQESYSLPPLSVPKSIFWDCLTRNNDADGTNDSGLPSNSRSIISTKGLNGSSSVIPSQNKLSSPTAVDQENERHTDIAVNAVVVNEEVNCGRSQNDDQRGNAVVENENVNRQRSQNEDQRGNAVVVNEDVKCEKTQNDDHRGNAVVVNEDVNCKKSQKDSQRATRSSKKVHPPPFKTYALRNKGKKDAVAESVRNKRAEKPNVEQLAVTEIAASVEDTQPKASESRSLFIAGFPCRKARKVRMRRLADLSDKPNTTREESSSRKESLRDLKRKAPPGIIKLSRKHGGGSESTESGFNTDPIKGKKKNVRFQVDDPEVEDELVQEDVPEKDANPYPLMAKRTVKVKIAKKRRTTRTIGPSKKASSSVQPSLEEKETVASPPREQRREEIVGTTSLDDQLASEGYVRKSNAPVDERQDNSSVRSREVVASYVPVFGNPSIPNTGRGLGTGPGAIYFGGSNNNNNQRSTLLSTVVAAQSSVPQKDASVSDRKGKRVMVQSDDETDNTQTDDLPDMSNNLTQEEVPQKPKTPFLFDLNEKYEEDTSLEENTNEARGEDRVPIRPEQQNSIETLPPRQNSVETLHPRQNSHVPPRVQERRRRSIPIPRHNPEWMGNVPMATHHHHPSPPTYQVMRVPHQFRAPSPPVWASSSSMIPPQCCHHHHHLSPAPFNIDYPSMLAQQAPSSLSCYEANLLNQAMMSGMDPRFRSNTPVDHYGNMVFTPRHVHPVNQYSSNLAERQQRSHERPVLPRIRNQGRFQRPLNSRIEQRRNVASSSNTSASPAGNSSASSICIVSRNPAEFMVPEEDLHVHERLAEFEKAGPVAESG